MARSNVSLSDNEYPAASISFSAFTLFSFSAKARDIAVLLPG